MPHRGSHLKGSATSDHHEFHAEVLLCISLGHDNPFDAAGEGAPRVCTRASQPCPRHRQPPVPPVATAASPRRARTAARASAGRIRPVRPHRRCCRPNHRCRRSRRGHPRRRFPQRCRNCQPSRRRQTLNRRCPRIPTGPADVAVETGAARRSRAAADERRHAERRRYPVAVDRRRRRLPFRIHSLPGYRRVGVTASKPPSAKNSPFTVPP